jgi:Tol biopolymer transport system component
MSRFCHQSIILFLIFVIAGCGGGDGTGVSTSTDQDNPSQVTGNTTPDNPDDSTSTNSGVNGELTGWLFIAEDGKYLDLSTGTYTKVTSDHHDNLITPSADGTEYVERTKSFRMEEDNECYGFLIDIERVAIRDIHSNLIKDVFEVYEDLWGPAKLSPDGQAIAVDWANDKGCPSGESVSLLTVFNRQGNILSQTSEEVGSFTWLPDNRLVYENNGAIYVATEPYQVEGVAVKSLAGIAGYPSRMRTNPDGSKIIFEMVTGGPMLFETVSYRDATVWMMNVDGTGLKLYATTQREDDPSVESDDPRLNNPMWSPDGDKIITMEGYFSGVGIVYDDLDLTPDSDYIVVPTDRKGLTYVVPANENEVKLPPNGEFQASILSALGSDGAIPFVESVDSHLFLVPNAETPVEIAGSLPSENTTQINRGIGGNIIFINESQGDTVVSALSVESGNMTDIVTLSTDEHDEYYIDFSMSNDMQYFAFYDYEYLDDKHINLFNSSGEMIRQYSMYTVSYDISPSSRIHFSPLNNNLLLFEYEDNNDDDKHYVTILDWSQDSFIRTFSDRQYFDPLWTPDGDLVIWDERNTAYLVQVTDDQVGNPIELFSLPESSAYHSISPDGNRMIFKMARHIWSINMDGTLLTQITAPKVGYETYPVWSPDGQYILFKSMVDNSFGSLWIVASNAEHIRASYSSNNLVAVSDSNGRHLRQVYGPLAWVQ